MTKPNVYVKISIAVWADMVQIEPVAASFCREGELRGMVQGFGNNLQDS